MFSLSKCFLWQIVVEAQVWKGNIKSHLFRKVLLLETEGKVCTAVRTSCKRSIFMDQEIFILRLAAAMPGCPSHLYKLLYDTSSRFFPVLCNTVLGPYSGLWKEYCKTTAGTETTWVQGVAPFLPISYKIMTVWNYLTGFMFFSMTLLKTV